MTERPRKVQAPKVRQTERRPAGGGGGDGRQRLVLYAVAASGLVALAVVLVVVLTRGGGGGSTDPSAVKAAFTKAGCTFESVKATAAGNHIADVSVKVKYNTFPPTNGPHVSNAAPWGLYEDPINQKILVHNLEHGGIILQYGPKTPADTQQRLTDFFNESPNGIVVAPLPALGDKIALGAWTAPELSTNAKKQPQGTAYLAKCTSYDAAAFEKFRDAFRYKGPERIPADLMQPGQ